MKYLMSLGFFLFACDAGFGLEDEGASVLERDTFLIEVAVTFSPHLFQSTLRPEGWTAPTEVVVRLYSPPQPAPLQWLTTQQFQSSATAEFLGVHKHFGIAAHPMLTHHLTQIVELPAYICALAIPLPEHRFDSAAQIGVTSQCEPYPPELAQTNAGDLIASGWNEPEDGSVDSEVAVHIDALTSSNVVNPGDGFLVGAVAKVPGSSSSSCVTYEVNW